MVLPLFAPLGAHGQAVLAHGDRDAQGRTQVHGHGLHGLVQGRVFAGLTTGGHPIGRQFDLVHLKGGGHQIGQGFSHGHATCGWGIEAGQGAALANGHGLTGKTLVIGQGDGAIGHRHLPGADHLVAVGQTRHRAVTNGDQKPLGRHRGMAEHLDHRICPSQAIHIHGLSRPGMPLDVAVHFGRFTQQHIERHVYRVLARGLVQRQMCVVSGHTDDGKGAALSRTQGAEGIQRCGRQGQHITLLAFIAPNLARRHAAFFQRNFGHVKARPAPSIVDQLGKRIRQATCPHIVDGQNRVGAALGPTLVDDLLCPALNFGVAALHRIKVEVDRIRSAGQGAGCATAQANAHARPPQLDEQGTCGETNFFSLQGVNAAQAARDHDGLVVAAHHARDDLLVFAKVADQVGPAKLVVECRRAQGPLGHDLQSTGHVGGTLQSAVPQFGHGEAGQGRLGP